MCKLYKIIILYLTLNNFLFLFLGIAITATSTALFTQHVLGFIPCAMCFLERIPYYCMIFTSLFGIVFKKYAKLSIGMIVIFFIANVILSSYHVALEHGLLEPTEMCKGNSELLPNISIEDLRNILYSNNKANCAQPPFKILSLSFAEWNLLSNLMLLIGIFYIFKYKNLVIK